MKSVVTLMLKQIESALRSYRDYLAKAPKYELGGDSNEVATLLNELREAKVYLEHDFGKMYAMSKTRSLANSTPYYEALDSLSEAIQVTESILHSRYGSRQNTADVVQVLNQCLDRWGILTHSTGVGSEYSDSEKCGFLSSSAMSVEASVKEALAYHSAQPAIDIAILTVLPEEYKAVYNRLVNPHPPPTSESTPTLYGWKLGEIPTLRIGELYNVALGIMVRAGTNRGILAAMDAINRWKPRYIFFVGIAGGFRSDGLKKGDVVIADIIYGYEYGKLDNKEFIQRYDYTYRTDPALLSGAVAFATLNRDWVDDIRVDHPEQRTPKALVGKIASGDKVVDDPTTEFFSSVAKAFGKLHAVEMEGAGVAAAIEQAQSSGASVGFLMVRGISDIPRPDEGTEARGTEERDSWKPYAANTAAAFTVSFIANGLPLPPSGLGTENQTLVSDAESGLQKPQLTLKLLQLGRDRSHREEIVFDQKRSHNFDFGFALENAAESTVAKDVHIEITVWWHGDRPQHPLLFQKTQDIEGWGIFADALLQEQPVVFEFRDSKLTCPFQHPRRWTGFRLLLQERINGYFELHYGVSSLQPYSHSRGKLRIVMA